MAINHKSGRVVVDLESELKMALHAALASEGMSLKQWLSLAASEFIAQRGQHRLAFGNTHGTALTNIRTAEELPLPRSK